MKIMNVTPDNTGYTDRSTSQWQGLVPFMQRQESTQAHISERTVKLSTEEVYRWLYLAHMKKTPMIVQADVGDERDDQHHTLTCMVEGYNTGAISLRLKDERLVTYRLDQIQHIEKMDLLEWYDNRTTKTP